MADEIIDCTTLAPGRGEGTLRCSDFTIPNATGAGEGSSLSPEEELRRFKKHAEEVCRNIRDDIDRLEEKSGVSEADILRGHASILEDGTFHDRVESAIHEMELAAEAAVEHVLDDMAELFSDAEDPVFRERAADFRDLKLRLRERLEGRSHLLGRLLESTGTPVVAVSELYPSMVLKGYRRGVRAFITESGTSFAHAAILAKSSGLPVVRVGTLELLRKHDGSPILVDADQGRILIRPSSDERAEGEQQVAEAKPAAAQGAMKASLWLNVTDPGQLDGREWGSAKGVGLYRTESLFMSKPHGFPSEAEQIRTYRDLFDRCGNRPVTVRTVDIGGDKPVGHMTFGPQENPQLGLRAHRLYRYHPELLVTQLRAILRAAHPSTTLRLLYPLIETSDQWEFVQELTGQAVASLRDEDAAFRSEFSSGPLIETPSAVWEFDGLVADADFVSVGTNDLVQYLFAADRNNANAGFMYQPEHPVVLRVLQTLQQKADAADCPLSICGEMAGNRRYLPLLVGLGIKNVSVIPSVAEGLEAALRGANVEQCRELAEKCLQASGVEEVRHLLDEWHGTPRKEDRQAGGAVDPVCGMTVDPEETPFTLEVDGVQHYFCSRHCLETFKRPDKSIPRF